MRVIINGTAVDVESHSLADILAETGHDLPHVATALNGTFVRKAIRTDTPVSEGDRIEIVAPLEGG